MPERDASRLFPEGIRALNVGLAGFADPIRAHGGTAVQIDWRPPAEADRALGLLIARLADDPDDPIGEHVARANALAVERIVGARPILRDVRPAAEVIPALGGRTILHSGPPIEWERMCGPARGAAIGATLFEGWATSPSGARDLIGSGAIAFAPCHQHGAVGPMAGVISPSMPVLVVENETSRNRAYAPLNDGLGKVLRFGAYEEGALERLGWLRDVLGTALGRTLREAGPIELRAITAQALHMGDDGHSRTVAGTSLFARAIAPTLVRAVDVDTASAALDFLRRNDQFYVNLSMAACKSTLDAAHGIPSSTVVTAMSRNGVDFGIRLSGTGDAWFTAPATVADGVYFPGYGPEDANPDLGDGAITETCGIGAFAIANAPAIVRLVGGTAAQALGYTREMYRITLTKNVNFSLPALGFAGTPTAIDARRVVESGVVPVINTGIAHRQAGIGQIGAGIARAPLACFADALRALALRVGVPA